MNQLKIVRSQSLDESENIYHQMMVQREAKELRRVHETSRPSSISHLRKRYRKVGLGFSENKKNLSSIIRDQLCSEKAEKNLDQRNIKSSSSSLNFNADRFTFCLVNYQNLPSDDYSFALSEKDLDETKENLKFADDDDDDNLQERNDWVKNCSIIDQYDSTLFEEQKSYCLSPVEPLVNINLSKPSIVIDSSQSLCTDTEEDKLSKENSETFENFEEKNTSENLTFKEWGGRKSEPTFPCAKKTSNYLIPPNLEIRRHTLPNSANKTLQNQGMSNFSPIFSTSSWETLPPEEEMEIMEDKPIEMKDDIKDIHKRNTSTPKSENVKDILDAYVLSVNNSDVFEKSYKEQEEDITDHSFWDVNSAPVAPDSCNPKIKFSRTEINTETSYWDSTPQIIKLHPKRVKTNYDESSEPKYDKSYSLTSTTYDRVPYNVSDISEWQEVRLINKNNLNGNGNSTQGNSEEHERKFKEHDEFCNSVIDSISSTSEDSENEIFCQGLYNVCNDSNRTYDSSSPLISSEEETSSENDAFEGGDKSLETHGHFKTKDSILQDEEYFYKVFEDFSRKEDGKETIRRSFIKKTFSDPEIFTQNKRGNIQLSRDTYSAVYNVATNMVASVLSDASTQTSFTSTPIRCSPTLSFAWLPEGYDDSTSLEPCASSLVFSFSDDEEEEEDAKEEDEQSDWWMTEESFSSLSSEIIEDNYSLALSESLDNLDQNIESGIGTVSTCPSRSPFATKNVFDFSCSNLYSEDTGLEISFDRRSKIMLPGTSYFHDAYLPFFKKENLIRLENQATQTDPEQRGKCLLLVEKSKINKILKEHMKGEGQEIENILSDTDILKYNLKKIKGVVDIEDISPYSLETPGLRKLIYGSLESVFGPNKEGSLKTRSKRKLRNDFQNTTIQTPLLSQQNKHTNLPNSNFYDLLKTEQEFGPKIKKETLKEIS
ncbi:hypothetical protein Avbf_13901, partial [Armadillidium vulgare]